MSVALPGEVRGRGDRRFRVRSTDAQQRYNDVIGDPRSDQCHHTRLAW